ncbi:MAG: PD-(D/E)XK nuclease family protein [Anaerolineae bacterium]
MALPKEFQFSQASLQDFVDCSRRFQLRHLRRLQWPAVEAEPVEERERRMELGMAFHRMVQQHVIGIEAARIARTALDPDLRAWWQSYLTYRPIESFGGASEAAQVRSEVSLVGQVAGYRLIAKYDLVIIEPGRQFVILDWKTSKKRTPEDVLRRRLQTRVYPFLAVQAGARLAHGQSVEPSHVEMVFWFPAFPQSPARLVYDETRYAEDADFLRRLIGRIAGMGDDEFYLTDVEERCLYCAYRSYCERGVKAGALADVMAALELEEQVIDLEMDFEQIAEIEF